MYLNYITLTLTQFKNGRCVPFILPLHDIVTTKDMNIKEDVYEL